MSTIEETRKKAKASEGWYGTLFCPQCGSAQLQGEGIGKPSELPDPEREGNVIVGWLVVRFTCTVCQYQWIDGEPSEAEKLEEAGWPGLFDHQDSF